MNCFSISIRHLPNNEKNLCRGSVPYDKELFSLSIELDKRKHRWQIELERYRGYKVIVVSFYLSRHKNAKGILKYKRNEKWECINPLVVLKLFQEIFNLCTNEENRSYSFCFYAVDDEYVEKREDINKRMSAYINFLQRDVIKNRFTLKQKGNILNNFFVGYNDEYCSEEEVDKFIAFYEPILLEEIKELYGEQESQKL